MTPEQLLATFRGREYTHAMVQSDWREEFGNIKDFGVLWHDWLGAGKIKKVGRHPSKKVFIYRNAQPTIAGVDAIHEATKEIE